MSHRMIQKIHLVKNYDDGVLQEKYAQIIGSFMFWQTVYVMLLYMSRYT
jgi:hypothetical protein